MITDGLPNQIVYNLYGRNMTMMELIFLRNNTEDEEFKNMLTGEINRLQIPVIEMIKLKYKMYGTK